MSGFTVTFGGGSGSNVAAPPVTSIPASDGFSTKASPFQVTFKGGGTVSSVSTVAAEQTATSSIKRPGGFSVSLVGGGGDAGGGAEKMQQQESEGKTSKPRRKQKGPHNSDNESGGTSVSVTNSESVKDFGAGRKVVLTPDTTEKSKSRTKESRDSASGNKALKSKNSDKNQDDHHIEQHQQHHHHEDQRRIKQQQPAIGRTVTIESSHSFTTKAVATTSTTPTTGTALPEHLSHLPFDTRMRIQKDITRGVLRNDGSPRSNFNFGQLNVINGQLAAAAGASDTQGGGKGGGGRVKPANINSKPIVMRPEFDRERKHDSDFRGKYDTQHSGVQKGPSVQTASRSREQDSFARSKSTVNSNTPQNVSLGSSSVNTLKKEALGDSECSQIDDSVPVEVWVPPKPTNPESLKPYRRTKNWGDDDDEDD